MTNATKHKRLQKEYSDEVYKSYFRSGVQGSHPSESQIGNFIDYYALKKAVSMLPFSIKGKTVLSICCGDGFEAEYLNKLGAEVTVSDISGEAVKAAKRRCRYLKGAIADSEHLPFKDKCFDLVFVRDGLHHLPNPHKGVHEMNRVSKYGFVFIEAQKNFITNILIMLKIAQEYEISGNYVYRFPRQEIHKLIKKLKIKNYKIKTFWCHHIDFLSKEIYPVFNNKVWLAIFRLSFYIFNFLFGYYGNSMVVVVLKD